MNTNTSNQKNNCRGRVSDFFFGKKETLAQSILDGLIRSVFSGLIVAVAALYLIGEIEHRLELSQKKEAARTLRNEVISSFLKSSNENYQRVDCAHNHLQLRAPNCNNELDQLNSKLQTEYHLLKSILPEEKLEPIQDTIKIGVKLRELETQIEITQVGEKLVDEFSDSHSRMIQAVAQLFE